jgi:hypothetical protein
MFLSAVGCPRYNVEQLVGLARGKFGTNERACWSVCFKNENSKSYGR